jgi:hypothetical protein
MDRLACMEMRASLESLFMLGTVGDDGVPVRHLL